MTRSAKIAALAFAAVLLLLGALSVGFGGPIAWSDAKTLHARWLVSEWRDDSGPAFSPELWQGAIKDLQEAARNVPENAALHDDLGFLYASRAVSLGPADAGTAAFNYQQQLLGAAVEHYRLSTQLRPTFPYSWAYLALALQMRGQITDELWAAYDKAYRYGQTEGGAQPALAQVAFAQWPTLDDGRKQNIIKMVDSAHRSVQERLLDLAAEYKVKLH